MDRGTDNASGEGSGYCAHSSPNTTLLTRKNKRKDAYVDADKVLKMLEKTDVHLCKLKVTQYHIVFEMHIFCHKT